MPTCDRALLIGETIESIRSQDFNDWELIIIDDGSGDNTAEVVGRFNDPRIHFHAFSKIGYGIKLRATGIAFAKGELIAFADSDDPWASEKLGLQVKALSDHTGAMFCLTGGYNFREAGQPLEFFYPGKKGHYYGDLLLKVFRSELSLFPQTLLFRRDCIPLIEEYVSKDPGADIEFLVGFAGEFKGVVLYESLLFRRLHQNNFSSREWEHGYKEGIHMIRKYHGSGKLSAKEARQSLFRLYIHYGEKCRIKRKPLLSLKQFLQAWKNRPLSIIPVKKIGKLMLYNLKAEQSH
jgi:glycosyltransferase involved in cell wall biosynthesis